MAIIGGQGQKPGQQKPPFASFGREFVMAARYVHECYGCPDEIKPGYSYIKDRLLQPSKIPGHSPSRLFELKWHLGCAPVVKREAEDFARAEYLRVS